jgi:hypothetical protein
LAFAFAFVVAALLAATPTAYARPRDSDRDGLTNRYEKVRSHTNPHHADTDRDGLRDGFEVHRVRTNPRRKDTDGDGVSDGLEVLMGTNARGKPPKALRDMTPPETYMMSAPSGTTPSSSASFSFISSEPGSSFQCRLDSGTWGACASPKAYTGVSDGAHSFAVRATDAAGNTDATPATASWTVATSPPEVADTTPPDTAITAGPSGTVSTSDADFHFVASESSSSFQCRVDAGTWGSCNSPKAYSNMSDGGHSFNVRATDAAGNTDPSPAADSWTVATSLPPVDTTPPETTITSGPSGTVSTGTASFDFSSSELLSTFECRLDGGAWGACSPPKAYVGLADGSHAFDVRATDALGNTDQTPATRSWTVATAPPPDTTPPDTTITSGPSGTVSSASASFGFSASESGSSFECRLDGGAWGTCSSPKAYSGLADGSHTLDVRSKDAAGNVDATPATRSWTVQTPAAPSASFTWSPQNPLGLPVTVTFTSTGTCPATPCTYEWRHGPPAGDAIGTGQTASFAYQSTGTKTVVLKVTDALGRNSEATNSFNVSAATPPPPPAAQCADTIDNDGDGAIDLADPGCVDAGDNDESNAPPPPPPPGNTSSVSQYGITWTFSQPATVGKFANGDWWVVGPVAITSITPAAASGLNGWQPNPPLVDNHAPGEPTPPPNGQAFDRAGPDYSAGFMPVLPYTAQPGTSIVKAVSRSGHGTSCDGSNPCLQTAAVLTVLGSVPPNNGATLFRPPYVGTAKPLFSTDALDAQIPSLPRLASTTSIDLDLPTLQQAFDRVKRPDIGYHVEEVNAFHPVDNVLPPGETNPYTPGLSGVYVDSVLRALVARAGDNEALRRDVLIAAVQRGIDIYGARAMGMHWYAAGGTNYGPRGQIAFAAWALNNQQIKDTLARSGRNDFAETGSVWPSALSGGQPEWGQDRGSEQEYWDHYAAQRENTTERDPYGFIDGGYTPSTSYQLCCTSSALKGQALMVRLIPGMAGVWGDPLTLTYADRWVNTGQWTQPDPCAPLAQGGGPDPNGPGCILDPDLTPGSTMTSFSCQPGKQCGRFPTTHAANADASGWGDSGFMSKMWDRYR